MLEDILGSSDGEVSISALVTSFFFLSAAGLDSGCRVEVRSPSEYIVADRWKLMIQSIMMMLLLPIIYECYGTLFWSVRPIEHHSMQQEGGLLNIVSAYWWPNE